MLKHYLTRFGLYGAGFFIFSVGSAFAIKSTLGVTATTSLPLSLSRILGTTVGTMMIVMSVIYVAAQVLILRKDFKVANLAQVACGLMMGTFVDLALAAMTGLVVTTYLTKFILMLLSLPLIALGLSLIVNMNFLPSPAEGFVLAISKKSGRPFPKLKVLVDCITLALAFALLLATSNSIENFREGTVMDALFIGLIIGLFNKLLAPLYSYVNKKPAKKEALPRAYSEV